jgi:hypothetical protein
MGSRAEKNTGHLPAAVWVSTGGGHVFECLRRQALGHINEPDFY